MLDSKRIMINGASIPLRNDAPTRQLDVRRLGRVALALTDATMVALAFALAYWLRFSANIALSRDVVPSLGYYTLLVAFMLPLWLGIFALLGLYDYHNLLGGVTEYTRVLNGCTSGMMLVIIASFAVPNMQIARAWLVMSWLLSFLLVCLGRFTLRRMAYHLRGRGYFVSRAVILGTNDEAITLAMQLGDMRYSGIAVLGFVVPDGALDDAPKSILGVPVLGTLERLPSILDARAAELVIVAATALTREQLINLPLELARQPNVELDLSSGLYEVFTTGMRITNRCGVPLMSVNRLRLHPIEKALKLSLDYTLIALTAVFSLPLAAFIALLIRLDSPGPVIYRRRVMGVGGKEFDAFKFRTMVVNGDEVLAQHPELLAELNANHKLKDDPRVTRVGRRLRAASLDELPQLINVLRGQMSLVGPRMISPEEAAQYGRMRLNLLTVKPGITGLWQTSGRSDLSYDERVQLDMYYIRNYSIWLDLQILFIQTLPAVLHKRGAY